MSTSGEALSSVGLRLSFVKATIFLLLIAYVSASTARAQFAGGSGTPDDPYQIATAGELISIGSNPELLDKHFVLVNDIDLDPNLPDSHVFSESVIAPSIVMWAHVKEIICQSFTGSFDGNGKSIRNLVINAEGEDAVYVGLFGSIAGNVRNIKLENIHVSGNQIVGGLVGLNKGNVKTCSISGTITGQFEVGALAGRNEGTVNSCHTEGIVYAIEKSGGVVGYHDTGTIAFTYSITSVDGDFDIGGLIGASGEGTVYLSYWDIDISGLDVSAGGRGKHSIEMMNRRTYRGWGYPEVWKMNDHLDYPRLFWEAPDYELIVDIPPFYGGGTGEPNNPFQIWSSEQFISVGYYPGDFNECFVLMADIDLNDIDPNEIVPIGSAKWPFRGLFDGNGYTISNLTCSLHGQSCVGMFGFLERFNHYDIGIVKNLHLENVVLYGGNLTGAFVGNNKGQVVNCSATGIVKGINKIGGLVGNNECIIQDCNYIGDVEGEVHVGGICGYCSWGNRIFVKSSSSSGTVTGFEDVGGLVGYNSGGYGYDSGILSCYAINDVFGENNVGGLVGLNNGNIQQSYYTGNVTGTTDVGGFAGRNCDDILECKCSGSVSGSTSVGGFVGNNFYGTIKSCYTGSGVRGNNAVGGLVGRDCEGMTQYCYSFGSVIADGNDVGGLIGFNRWDIGDYFMCYWDTETSGITISRGGFGRPTRLMMSSRNFRGWAETGVWTILEGLDYPRLVWEEQAGERITNNTSLYGGGTGDPNDPYQIWTCEQFIEIAYRPEDFMRNFVLMADVNMSEIDNYEIIPIGSLKHPFIGSFDGNGYNISNYNCICPGSPYTGVFGFVGWSGFSWNKPEGAIGRISNLNLTDAYVSGGSQTGILVGASAGQIKNITVKGYVRGLDSVGGLVGVSYEKIQDILSEVTASGVNYVGGLIGYSGNEVVNSFSSGVVNGNSRVGGLIGFQRSNYNINSCVSFCQVIATGICAGGLAGECSGHVTDCNANGNVTGYKYVGGLVGFNGGNLRDCFATGRVNADGNSVGGLVGLSSRTNSSIIACYAIGDVQANNSVGGLVGTCLGSDISQCYSSSSVYGYDMVGGLIGTANNPIRSSYERGTVQGHDFIGGLVGVSTDPVIECYSTGRVSGNRIIGGLIGRAWYKEVESCFWDIEKSQQNRGEDYSEQALEGIFGKTTVEMQSADTFINAGWDFDDIWMICEGVDYPRLQWQNVCCD